MIEDRSIVYVAFNDKSENKSVYIGKTKFSLFKRKNEHEKRSINKPKSPFHKAIRSYGIENFTWYEIIDVKSDEVNDLEKFYISEFIKDGYNLYNITTGGDGGDTISNHPNRESIIENMRKAQRERFKDPIQGELIRSLAIRLGYGKWMIGKKLTEEHKNNIGQGIQLALLDEEKRNRISRKGQKRPPFTEKHKENLSKASKNKPKSINHCKSLSEVRKNQRWIYSEKEQRSTAVPKEEVDKYLLMGWVLGRKSKILK